MFSILDISGGHKNKNKMGQRTENHIFVQNLVTALMNHAVISVLYAQRNKLHPPK